MHDLHSAGELPSSWHFEVLRIQEEGFRAGQMILIDSDVNMETATIASVDTALKPFSANSFRALSINRALVAAVRSAWVLRPGDALPDLTFIQLARNFHTECL